MGVVGVAPPVFVLVSVAAVAQYVLPVSNADTEGDAEGDNDDFIDGRAFIPNRNDSLKTDIHCLAYIPPPNVLRVRCTLE